MTLHIVPYYAAALALFFVFLSVNVVRWRRDSQIALGTGGNPDLERCVRVHANFAEYVPFALLLLAMAELRGAPAVLLHVLCICLVVGRIAHAIGVSQPVEDYRFRTVAMALTFLTLIGAALSILLRA